MSTEERVAVLETQMEELQKTLAKLQEGQEAMLLKFTEYKGRWGGIVMTITAIGTLIAFAKDEIMGWFTGGR